MAAELTSTKLNAENHLLLDQPLLRLPHELARRNFKSVQRLVEREREYVIHALKEAANASLSNDQTPDQTLAALDSMLARMQNLKRKMESIQQEEKKIQNQSRKRIQHLEHLHQIPSLADVKYDQWSRIRLDRLVVDHMLRSGYTESAQRLAQEKGIEDLVDLDVFVQCQRIAQSLRRGETKDALRWCNENKAALKKSQFNLEFELRLQQYIEMLRTGDRGKLMDAMAHAKRYLTPYTETQSKEIHRAAGLLAFPQDTKAEPYKTPSCHSAYTSSSSNSLSTATSVCPICSTELNELARNMPYAHHAKSYVESDPIVLPNGRIYGQQRLLDMSKKLGCVETGKVKDPTTGEIFDESEMKKVYIM
ncbi:FYV10 family protein [Aspergillus fischeri NRRL 181]|uniref:FYV10 family protein n=1 Tax=Neosartorya fischeri (strain ATCC 1020 / DSM 3700 / CBS 544.65 / FGSC A1164 / JCM 1740 / NRRL 181 / WB 181) TaxID=331117 RepID=UPI0000EA66CF|nr:negative regulation of gluconeogenesis, putative [Aspergillus fischeri NRRL 181]EAW24165.1 negative regulation of gluconeogenesis, putative [Aspergillus fischeri NRRL 181]